MKSYFSKNRVNYIVWAMIVIGTLVAIIFYSFLPKEIPMQWNDVSVNWYANKLAIFIYPIISIAIMFLLKPMLIVRFHTPIVPDIATVGIIFMILSCEIYTIAYCFGLRWRIDHILLIELVSILVIGIVKHNNCMLP